MPFIKYILFVLCSVLAVAGNYFRVDLFFGADFLFGGIFVILALYFFGYLFGLLAVAISAIYTILLWGHPYAYIVFILEILVLGAVLRRNRQANLIYADLLYWLVGGMPLVFILYRFVLDVPTSTALYIMQKQAANGVFNAIIASIAIIVFSQRGWPRTANDSMPITRKKVGLESVFTVILALVSMTPALYSAAVLNRAEIKRMVAQMQASVNRDATRAATALELFLGEKTGLLAEHLTLFANGIESDEIYKHFLSVTIKGPATAAEGASGLLHNAAGPLILNHDSAYPVEDGVSMQACPSSSEEQCLILSVTNSDGLQAQGWLLQNTVTTFLKLFSEHEKDIQFRLVRSVVANNPQQREGQVNLGGIWHTNTPLRYFESPLEEELPLLLKWQTSAWHELVPVKGMEYLLVHANLSLAKFIRDVQNQFAAVFTICLLPAFLVLIISPLLSRLITSPIHSLSRISQKFGPSYGMLESNTSLRPHFSTTVIQEVDSLAINIFKMIRAFHDERKKNLELLKSIEGSERQIRDLLRISEDAILLVDKNQSIMSFNHGAEKIFGYRHDEVVGKQLEMLIPERFREEHGERVKGFIAGDISSKRMGPGRRVRGLRKDGREIVAEATIAKIETGSEMIMTAIIRNVTDQVDKEQRLAAQSRLLVKLASNESWFEDDLVVSLKYLVSQTCTVVNARAVSIWLCTTGVFRCLLHFDALSGKYRQGLVLENSTDTLFLEAVRGKQALQYSSLEKNPPHRFVRSSCLEDEVVTSALDVPIFREGRLLGCLSVEETGVERAWYRDEVDFSCSIAAFVSLLFEVDDRRKANKEARQTRDELVRLIDTANAPIFGVDEFGHITEWNQAAERITGYSKAEVLGMSLLNNFIGKEHRSAIDGVLTKALRGVGTANFELQLIRRSGEKVIILLNATPRKSDEGTIVGVVGVGQDITDIHAYQTQMKQLVDKKTDELKNLLEVINSERLYLNTILNSAEDCIIVTDVKGDVVLANPAAEKIASEYFDENDRLNTLLNSNGGKVRENILAVCRGAHSTLSGKLVLKGIRDEKQDAVFSCTTTALGASDDELKGTVTILHDISSEAKVNEMMSNFVSTAAHELRTPLTTIQGFSELLLTRSNLAEEKREHYLQLIHKQSLRLGGLINDLLDLTRMEQGRTFRLHKTPCLVGEVVAHLLEIVQPGAPNHEFKVVIEENLPPILVDKEKMGQVMLNLLNNAIKYSPEGGEIRVSFAKDRQFLKVSIADQGVGIDSKQLRYVFDKFYRVDASNSAVEGTGLGLPIVKYIIEAHQGKIWLDSELGKGSTVHFVLPYEQVDHAYTTNLEELDEPKEDSHH